MKLIVCVFLVLVILEQYHCDPCLDWLFRPRHRDHGGDRKLGFDGGFSTYSAIQGSRRHRDYGHSPWHSHRQYSPYGTNSMGFRQRHYAPWAHPQYNTPYGWRQTSFRPQRPQYERPQYGIQYPSPYDTGRQSPPNRSPDVSQDEENSSQKKNYIVTPDGIREALAQ